MQTIDRVLIILCLITEVSLYALTILFISQHNKDNAKIQQRIRNVEDFAHRIDRNTKGNPNLSPEVPRYQNDIDNPILTSPLDELY